MDLALCLRASQLSTPTSWLTPRGVRSSPPPRWNWGERAAGRRRSAQVAGTRGDRGFCSQGGLELELGAGSQEAGGPACPGRQTSQRQAPEQGRGPKDTDRGHRHTLSAWAQSHGLLTLPDQDWRHVLVNVRAAGRTVAGSGSAVWSLDEPGVPACPSCSCSNPLPQTGG